MSPNPEIIIAEVAEITGVPVAAITGRRRTMRIYRARVLAVAAVRKAKQHWPLVEVGDVFNRDHSAVIHAMHRHSDQLASCEYYQELWSEITRRIFPAAQQPARA